MGRHRIAAAIGDDRRRFLNLAGENDRKTDGNDHIDLVRLHAADNFAKLAHLAARPARLECEDS